MNFTGIGGTLQAVGSCLMGNVISAQAPPTPNTEGRVGLVHPQSKAGLSSLGNQGD
jgi:hypothetical protein